MRLRALLLRTAALGTLLSIAALLALALRSSETARTPAFANPEAAELRADQLRRPAINFPLAAPQASDRTTSPIPCGPALLIPDCFGQPTIAGIQGTGFEPDIRVDPSNPQRIYSSVPGSLSSDDSWIWHSRDGGKTFKWITASHPKVGKPVACAGGGDTELAVDGAGRLYFNDLTLANFSVGRSDDGGMTFPCNNTGVPSTLVDRQWYAIDGDPTALGPSGPTANSLYLASNDVGQGQPQCPVSGAGNNVLTVYRSVPGPAAGLQFLPSFKVAGQGTCDEGIMGNIEVSPIPTTTDDPNGPQLASPVHHVYVIHDDATFSKIRIGRCYPVALTPVPVTPSGLHCNDLLVSDLGDHTQVRTGANFPSLAIDKAGNLYAVWQQASVDAQGNIGNVSLRYSYSLDEGTTWSTPITIPTPGLLNNVMTWAEAGDDGRVGIVWYGTPAPVNPPGTCELGSVPPPTPRGGPDSVNGVWSLYYAQTLNGHDPAGVTFTPPVLAAQHHNHRGSVATVMGGLCGNRTALGDFFKFRVGAQGEANIIYSNSLNGNRIGHMMFVRQHSGPGLYVNQTVSNDNYKLGNEAADTLGDGVRELDSNTSGNLANLDIVRSAVSRPAPATCHPAGVPCYRVQMTLNNLGLTAPAAVAPDVNLVWLTQWITPADPSCASAAPGCANGGRNFHVYAESDPALGLRCFFGEVSITAVGGGVTLTYPPALLSGQLPEDACQDTTGVNGTITIEVPIASVSLEAGVPPLNPDRIYSVTASTMTLNGPSDSVPAFGLPPDVIDVARGYDGVFISTGVAVRSFTAKRSKGTTTFRWRTASENGLAGFNVYLERGAKRTRLNRSLIPAVRRGHAYLWRHRARGQGVYWLQWVRLDGTKAWYGPALT